MYATRIFNLLILFVLLFQIPQNPIVAGTSRVRAEEPAD